MTVPARPDSFEVADYVGVLRRRWWIVVGLAVLGAAAAAAYIVVAPKAYAATTAVYVNANAANANEVLGTRTTTAVNMDNEAQIVQSNSVATLAGRQLHSRLSPAKLTHQVSVTVPANTQVLQITCTASSPRRAAACAQAFANSYLASRQTVSQSKIKSETQELQSRAEPLQLKAITLRRQIRTLNSNSQELATKQAELADTSAQLATLRSDVANLGASINYNPGYIITAASPPATPASPKPLLYLPSGLMIGLLIGLVGAIGLDRRDERIRSANDIQRLLDLPVLFEFPQKRLGPQTGLISARSKTGRGFTELSGVIATALGEGDHIIVVAGTSAGPGASVVAANLAATLARTRSDVILVCADLTDTLTPQLTGSRPGGHGLAELLAGRATVFEVAKRAPEFPRLRVVPAGLDAMAAVNNMRYDTCRRIMAELQNDARYIVMETSAIGDGSDTFSLAEFCDAALVVVEISRTKRSEVADAVRRLDMMRTPVLGAVVLPPSGRRGAKTKFPAPASAPQVAPLRQLPQAPRPVPRSPATGQPPPRSPAAGQPPPRSPRPVTAEGRRPPLPSLPDHGNGAKPKPPARAGETLPMPRISAAGGGDKSSKNPLTEAADYEAGEG